MQKGSNLKKIEDNVLNFEEERQKRAPLKMLGGNEPPDENWLADLEAGTVFLARDKKQPNELQLAKYMVVKHNAVTTQLLLALPKNDQIELYVPTLGFSRAWVHIETLGVIDGIYEDGSTLSGKEIKIEQSEETDGRSDRTV